MSLRCWRNERGVSATTCRTRIRVWHRVRVTSEEDVVGVNTFKYSMKRFKNATKCSAFLMLPGMASFSRSSGRTSWNKLLEWTPKEEPYQGLTWRSHCHHQRPLGGLRPVLHIHLVASQHPWFWFCVRFWTGPTKGGRVPTLLSFRRVSQHFEQQNPAWAEWDRCSEIRYTHCLFLHG